MACSGCNAELRFAILGDRTGGPNQAIYESIWAEVAREKPAFVINVGDTIETPDDWLMLRPLWEKYRGIPLYFTPGNHDIWSAESEKRYIAETKRPPQYSFNFAGQIHITVLDNSRTDKLSDEQLAFLERDLKSAPAGVPRMVFFHRPFWILPLSFGSGAFELHRIAKQYGVAAVVCGHGHQFLKLQRDGIQYLEAGSSGASIERGTSAGQGAAEGWFYGWTLCTVRALQVEFRWINYPGNDKDGSGGSVRPSAKAK